MKILFDVVIIVLLFFLFGLSHTLLASKLLKEKVLLWCGDKIAFYRIAYNIISVLCFYLFVVLSPKPDIIIYDLNFPFDIIIFVLQILSLAGLLWAARAVDWKEFIGISQVKRWKDNQYSESDLDERTGLKTDGPFMFSRHPVYFFTMLFIGLRPTMSLFYIVTFICIVAYFYIGSVYEEKKLLVKYGDVYKNYQLTVPRFFSPGRILIKKHNRIEIN